jgi:type I restriction enzyme, S subunit
MGISTCKLSLRFRGFVDAWKQYKFDVVVNRVATGLNPRDNFQLNTGGKNYYVTIKNFHHGELRLDDDCDKVDDSALALIQNRSDLQKDDILFSSIGRVGDCYLVDKTPNNWNINESVFTLRPNQNIVAPLYLFHTIHSDVVLSGILNNVTGSTFKSIKVNDLKKAQVPVPSIDEQLKIGEFISSIDNLITFHQRKCEKLVNIKQAFLEKMFPKQGEVVPQIRFNGFVDAWDKRNIKELGKIFIGLVTTMTTNYTSEGTLLVRNSDIKENKFSFSNDPIFLESKFAQENASRMLKIGDVVTVHTGDVGTSAVIREYEENSIGFATINTRPNQNLINSDYLSCYLNTDTHRNFAVNMSTGDGRANYNLKEFNQVMVPLPNIIEQKQIASLVLTINKLVTLYQRRFEKLINIKKALLESLFVQ